MSEIQTVQSWSCEMTDFESWGDDGEYGLNLTWLKTSSMGSKFDNERAKIKKWIRFKIVYAESVCKIRPLSTSTDPKWRNVYRRMGLHRVGGSFCAILDLLGWGWNEFPVEKLFRKPRSRPGLVIMPQSAEHIRLKKSKELPYPQKKEIHQSFISLKISTSL